MGKNNVPGIVLRIAYCVLRKSTYYAIRNTFFLTFLFFLAACEMPGGEAAVPTPIQPVAMLPGEGTTAVPTPTSALSTPTPPTAAAPFATATRDAALADWTVLVYMNGDNNLEQAALLDLNEMEAAGSSPTVNVLAQLDRAFGESYDEGDWTETRRLRIIGDAAPDFITAEPLMTLGEQNMGDPAVLADFIRWGIQTYPANHYALILWDHGAGWNGVAFDEDTAELGIPDHLTLADLENALAAGLQDTGVAKLDVVGFDACLMAQLDVLNALRPYAQVAVASEELTPGLGWNFESVLRNLYARPEMGGKQLAAQIVNDFIAHYTAVQDDFVTLSAVDLEQLPEVAYQVEQLAAALAQEPAFVASAVGDARSGAESFARVYPDDVERYAAIDLHHFATILGQRSPDEAVIVAAQGVMTAVEQAILANGHGAGFDHSRGVSIYFPRRAEFYDPTYPQSSQLPNWNAFLTSYHHVGLAELPPPAISLHNVLNNVVGVQDPAFIEFQVVGRDIETVKLLAGLVGADGRRRLVEYDHLIPEPTYLPDGSQVTAWRDGVHDDFFIWDTEVTYLYDTAGNGDYVVMWPTELGSTRFTVQGQLRRADETDYVDANLVFDQSTDTLLEVWAVASNESNAPAEILPQTGDEFQMYNFYDNGDGTFAREPGVSLYFDEAGLLYSDWLPLQNGNYYLGMEAENVAGGTAVDRLDLTIANNEPRDGYQAYLDPYLGFKFLYPQSWHEPRYQDTLLYTTNQITNTQHPITQLLVTIYPNLENSVTPETLKQQTLQQFGNVSLLFEDERVVAGMRALSTAYGYTNASGEPHSGVFLTFIDNNRNGFVVDVDGATADEATTVSTIGTIADTWEFADAGVGLQPGKWATVDLDSFSIAQPADFTYQSANGWERFSSGQYTFVALRTEAAGRDTADVVAALARDAGENVENFVAQEPQLFPLGGHIWTRVDFSYDVAGLGTIWGFIMARVEAEQEIVAWAEAPSAAYNELATGAFLTMLADLTLTE